MRVACCLIAAAMFGGCIQYPAKEAAKNRGNADGEVMKLYLVAATEIGRKYDRAEEKVKADYSDAVAAAEHVRPDRLMPFRIAARLIATRDLALLEFATQRAAELGNLQTLASNYVKASGAVYDAWEAQGQLSASMVNEVRDGAMELVQIGLAVREAKQREDAARRALERSAEAKPEGEGG